MFILSYRPHWIGEDFEPQLPFEKHLNRTQAVHRNKPGTLFLKGCLEGWDAGLCLFRLRFGAASTLTLVWLLYLHGDPKSQKSFQPHLWQTSHLGIVLLFLPPAKKTTVKTLNTGYPIPIPQNRWSGLWSLSSHPHRGVQTYRWALFDPACLFGLFMYPFVFVSGHQKQPHHIIPQ